MLMCIWQQSTEGKASEYKLATGVQWVIYCSTSMWKLWIVLLCWGREDWGNEIIKRKKKILNHCVICAETLITYQDNPFVSKDWHLGFPELKHLGVKYISLRGFRLWIAKNQPSIHMNDNTPLSKSKSKRCQERKRLNACMLILHTLWKPFQR